MTEGDTSLDSWIFAQPSLEEHLYANGRPRAVAIHVTYVQSLGSCHGASLTPEARLTFQIPKSRLHPALNKIGRQGFSEAFGCQ
jgi:hypothetical protein